VPARQTYRLNECERLAARGCDPLTRWVNRCGRATPREPSRESRHPRKGCRRREEPPRGERAPSRSSNAYGRRSSEGKTFQTSATFQPTGRYPKHRACNRATVLYGGCKRETANSKSHGRVFARHAATSRGPRGRSWETEPPERPTGHSTEVKSPRHLERWRGPGEIQSWEIESLDCPQGTRAATVDALVSTPLRMGCLKPARPGPLPRRCIHTPKGCQDRGQMCVSRPRVG